ncbi:uncharacterized protein LOC121197707 isoform X2 [Toxotes jaculatrix]|uniref:uncharacterized protein LOC121197707 isoform X2 n=1 Tax=Toxotes jaculatrix TaxID=941984 RepID=UPI001B3B01E3|nr:uncharacterized protein LOC121197707 isoform X2 [Toxotes jaculatrix]
MLFGFFLLFFFCVSTVELQSTLWPIHSTTDTTTVEAKLSPLEVVATPDYPVAEGQTVSLHCSASATPASVNWSWQHLENWTWQAVSSSRDLSLTKPMQSGIYRCCAKSQLSQSVSHNFTVYIIAMKPTGENLGIAAFVLSILTLIVTVTILCWLAWQRPDHTLTTPKTAAKGFPAPEKAIKGGLPQTESDGDVYMNYTSTNQAYADLDPTNMTGDNLYSSLS